MHVKTTSKVVSVLLTGLLAATGGAVVAQDSTELVQQELEAFTPDKTVIEFQFSRYNSNGKRYRTIPAVWVITRKGEKWGVEFRSLMAPIPIVQDEN